MQEKLDEAQWSEPEPAELCMYATLLFYQRCPLPAMRRDTNCACMPSSRLLVWAQQKLRHLYMIQEFSFSSSQNLLGHINWTKQVILVQNEPLQIVKSGQCSGMHIAANTVVDARMAFANNKIAALVLSMLL